jgi:Tfp pilus assembly protein PilN
VKAVNLIPADAERAGGRISLRLAPATYGLLGVLAAALVLVTLYVLAGNDVASRKAQLASAQTELSQAQAEASRLGAYTQFASLAQTRVQTVRGIAATRFDWNAALANLARVVPANTSLASLTGTVVPGTSVGGSGGSGSALRSAQSGPAFEITGCTVSQDAVARLISRMRTMPDVTRVALGSSAKATLSQTGTTGSGSANGCKPGSPTFDLVVLYNPVVGAGANGATSLGSTPASAPGGAK